MGAVLAWFLGPLVVVACAFVLFRSALVDGQFYYRSDTVLYYFPLSEGFQSVLAQGKLLLWTQYLFGGFPLFADGEVGMLYPPNLIAYSLFERSVDAYIWLRVARHIMAGVFTYGYLRSLKLNGFGATIGALSFAFGSFMIAQMHHTNVVNTALWLPLVLWTIEMAITHTRRVRWLLCTLAGAFLGIEALGLHIQPLIMTGFLLAFYLPFRVMLCPIAWPRRKTAEKASDAPVVVRTVSGDVVLSEPPTVILSEAKDLSVEAHDGRNGNGTALSGPSGAAASKAPASGFRRIMRGPSEILRFAQDDIPGGLGRITRGTGRFLWRGALPWTGLHVAGSFHRAVLTGLLLGLIPTIAFGIAAVQVLPLVELGLFSVRGQGVSYQFSTSFSLPVQNLVTLLFPYFFRFTDQQYYWSLWAEWESALYVGIAPLVLAVTAVALVRRRLVLFFAVMAVVSVVMAFGGYSPYPLWDEIRDLPGFSSLRVPARFTMLTTFSLAVLAAFGADWLCRTLRPSRVKGRWTRLSRFAGVNGFAFILMALVAGVAGVAWWLVSFRMWIERDPNAVKTVIQQSYLSLRNDRPWLNADQILIFLKYTLDPTSPKTSISLELMVATLVLLLAWFAFRWLWRVWASLLVVLVAVDLLVFAMDFHPTMPIDQVTAPNAAARWLMTQNTDRRTRVYTTPGVRRTEPNKLMPFQLSEVTGYSSLQTKRHQEYLAKMIEYEKPLLDLYGARFVVMPRNPVGLPSYRYVGYNPSRPLADGPTGSRNAHVTFYMEQPTRTDQILLVSSLRDSVEILNGANVAEVVAIDTNGERITLNVKAGIDTSEWAYDRPDVTPFMKHNRAEVAGQLPVTDPDGRRYQANMYYTELSLDRTRTIQRVEFHYTYPTGALRLQGMVLWENPSTARQVLSRNRYILGYRDDEVAIMENPSALPETYLVPTAKVVKPANVLDTMAHGDFDPTRVVLLEPPQKDSVLPDEGGADDGVLAFLTGNGGLPQGRAEITSYGSTDIAIRTSASSNTMLFLADTYYPGWKALVDGKEEKIYRADYLFRAVPVPAGDHEVRFVFEPTSLALGRSISEFTLSTLGIVWAGLLLIPLVWAGARWTLSRAKRRIMR